jgi:chromosome segregation ATPase
MPTTQELLSATKSQLRARMAELRAEIDSVKSTSAPLQSQLDAAIAQQNALDAIIADLAAQIDAIEQPKLHALKTELAEVARAEIAIKVSA